MIVAKFDAYTLIHNEPLIVYAEATAFYGWWMIVSICVLPFELFVGAEGNERYEGV